MTNGQRRWRDGSLGDEALVAASTLERIRHVPPLPGAVLLLLLASAAAIPVLLTWGTVAAVLAELRGLPPQGLAPVALAALRYPWLVAVLGFLPPLCVCALAGQGGRVGGWAAGAGRVLARQIGVLFGGCRTRREAQHRQERWTDEDQLLLPSRRQHPR